MNKRFPAAILVFLFAGFYLLAQTPSARQKLPPRGVADGQIPAEMAWITLYTEKVLKNAQGLWEAKLMFGIEMVFVPAGEFLMGSPVGEEGREPDEGPVHRVFTNGIWIGKFEVTRSTWRTVMSEEDAPPGERDLPQTGVSYRDIEKFLKALQIESGLKFRLPTEAEWEKCCRGGNPSPLYGYLEDIAWHSRNSGGRPHPVGTKAPNGFGLYDMLGNAWEWCSDWYGGRYYESSPILNPQGPARGQRRLNRGGGYLHSDNYLRSAHRNSQLPEIGKPIYGFRLVLDAAL